MYVAGFIMLSKTEKSIHALLRYVRTTPSLFSCGMTYNVLRRRAKETITSIKRRLIRNYVNNSTNFPELHLLSNRL